jgi:stress response protein SCP2
MADSINDIILRTPSGGTAMLPQGEFEGPLHITKPLRLVGNNTTVWAKRGSVIDITARGVSIESVRAELTEEDIHGTAITAHCPAAVKNVEVVGSVKGFGAEDGHFDIPKTIELGAIAADEENSFTMTVSVPTETAIECAAPGVTFSPKRLSAGRNNVTVTVRGVSSDTLLYAQVLFKSAFIRRVYLTGRPVSGTAPISGKCIYEAPVRENESLPTSAANTAQMSSNVTDVFSVPTPPPIGDMPPLELKMGQRVSLKQYVGAKFSVEFSCVKNVGMDIDPYVFLLDENERSLGDAGLVFFGNESSEDGSVKYFPNDGHVEINLDAADSRIKKITLAYSIYAGGAGKNFGQVDTPKISISSDGAERIFFVMDRLTDETTAVAVEFYLYKGEWKLSAVGAGFRDGMAKLCNRYGIEVEE